MAKRKPARPATARAQKTARKAVRKVSKAAAGARAAATRAMKDARKQATRRVASARATATRAVKDARKQTTRKVAVARTSASKLIKKASRLATRERTQLERALKSAKAKAARKAVGVTRRAADAARKMAAPKTKVAARKATSRKVTSRKVTSKARPKMAARPAPAAKASKPAALKPSTKTGEPKPRLITQPAAPAAKAKAAPARKANLDRPRRTVADIHGVPSSLDMGAIASSARTGRAEMEQKLHEHTSSSPALTAGDVDADWASAEAVGDEAPGGDNPTPDQDVVEEIGRALGVEYEDGEELQGGDEIAERDRHRWELDPGSSDDFEER